MPSDSDDDPRVVVPPAAAAGGDVDALDADVDRHSGQILAVYAGPAPSRRTIRTGQPRHGVHAIFLARPRGTMTVGLGDPPVTPDRRLTPAAVTHA